MKNYRPLSVVNICALSVNDVKHTLTFLKIGIAKCLLPFLTEKHEVIYGIIVEIESAVVLRALLYCTHFILFYGSVVRVYSIVLISKHKKSLTMSTIISTKNAIIHWI